MTGIITGCSINPGPIDVSRSTPSIVEHLLQETRLAIIAEAKLQLIKSGKTNAIKLAGELTCAAEDYIKFRPTVLDDEGQRFYERYINVAIALDFTLESSESNNASTTIDFLRLISNGSASLELTAANNLTRDSIRSFVVSKTFKNLLTDSRLAKDCENFSAAPNFEYPISGSVGIVDVIHTFIELNEEKDLTLKKDAPNIYSDKLTFTTAVSGTASPKIALSPPTRPFHLTMAALNTTLSRTDTNILSLGLAFPAATKTAITRKNKPPYGGRRVLSASTPLIPLLPLAQPTDNETEYAAIQAIQLQRNNLFLDRIGSLPLR